MSRWFSDSTNPVRTFLAYGIIKVRDTLSIELSKPMRIFIAYGIRSSKVVRTVNACEIFKTS